MRRPDSVRDRVLWLLLSMVLLVTVVAGAGAVGILALKDDVEVVVDDLRPAVYSNITLRNDLTRAQAAVLGLDLTGEPEFRERYRTAVIDARAELVALELLVQGDAEVARVVARERTAAEAWLGFAEGLVQRGTTPASTPYLVDGQVAFDRFAEVNDEVSVAVNGAIEERGRAARDRARAVVPFVVLASFLGLGVMVLLARALVARVSGPLRALEDAVERLAGGDLATRVAPDGPREVRGVATALNSLAEENQRARELEEQVVDRLRRLDRAKDEFVSTVSHELRTPLTSISGYLELLEDDVADLEPRQRQMVAILRRNVGRLRSLIEDLLTLSQVESDAFRTSFDLVDLGHLASDVAHDVAEIAARAGVTVRPSVPEQPMVVHGDPGQLTRALLNLVTNAVKFSEPGSHVLLMLSRNDREAVVSVVDHGIGIPAAEVPTLGTRFFRASNAVQAEITGTGLGLRIVHTIAGNHGGRLEIESVEGQGTTARLVVPLVGERDHRNIRRLEEITEG